MTFLSKDTWKAAGFIIHREGTVGYKSTWKAYTKLKNDKPSGFCFAAKSLTDLSHALRLFNEHIEIPVIDLIPVEYDEQDPTEDDRPNKEVEDFDDDRPYNE